MKAVKEASGAEVKNSGLQKGDIILKINDSNIIQAFQTNVYAKASRLHDGYISKSNYNNVLEELKKSNPKIKNTDEILPKGTSINLVQPKDEEAIKLTDAALMGIEKIKNDDEKNHDKTGDNL